MAVFNEPNQWGHPLGNNADTSTLPDDAAATAGIASLQKLFQIINATPLEAGGIAPDREDVNALFKYLGDSIFYTMNGGVPSYNADYDYVAGRVVSYNDNIYKCIQANGVSSTVGTPDSGTEYWQRLDSNGAITGKIEWFAFNTAPEGYLVCNGAKVSRETYADLFAVIGTTFGAGDGSTTFNIPDLRDRYIIGANTNALGTYIAEQLPNINGSIDKALFLQTTLTDRTGAFIPSQFNDTHTTLTGAAATNDTKIIFNANDSNSIYTDNGKVYPASLALLPCIKY